MQTAPSAISDQSTVADSTAVELPPPAKASSFWEEWTEPLMFAAAFVELLLIAGLIHRAGTDGEATAFEQMLILTVSAFLWPAFIAEGTIAYLRRAPGVSRRRAAVRILMVWFLPPLRLGWIHPATNRIWLPWLGRQQPSKALAKVLDRRFGVPMLAFAFLILPVLALEMYQPNWAKHVPYFVLALDAAGATIWVAFAFELIVKASAAPSTLRYLKERWIDVAIVGLPTLEFVMTHWVDAAPIARLFRLSKVIRPDSLQAVTKAYRLRGLMMKGWQAFMLLESVSRLTGNSPAKQLIRLEARIADLEAELAEARADADELRSRFAPAVVVHED